MKTINKIGSLLIVALVCLYGCQDNEGNPDELIPGEVQFSLSDPDSEDRGNAAGAEAYEDARALIVTIIDDEGNTIYDQEQIELFNFSGTLVGEPLSLNPGNYQLTEFLVLDDQGTVIYATPIEGSEYAHLVNDPLLIDFAVTADETSQVVPEVIDVEEFTPDAFGYATFRFTIVEHFNFLMAAFIYDQSVQNLILTTASLTIYEQGTQNILYTAVLGDTTNVVAIEDGFDYRLLIEKTGYNSINTSFTNAELKAFVNDPLEIVLPGVDPMPTEFFTDSGQALSTASATSVNSGDLDGDGDLDLFITRTNGALTEVLINDGTGNYSEIRSLGILNVIGASLGDLDNDGDLDVLMAQWTEQPNLVYFNDGAGNFTDSGQTLGNSASRDVVLGDLDNDGDLDAIVNDMGGFPILLNDGNGTFTQVANISGTLNALDIALGDLNGDGNLDLFVANSGIGAGVGMPDLVFFNDGSASFSNSGQTLGNAKSSAVALADIDGDGDLDAFIGDEEQNASVWINDGNGTFTNSSQSLGSTDIHDVILIDFDLDGDFDAFTVEGSNGPHKLWWNNGSGTFTDSGLVLGSFSSSAIASGDFDIDGDIDVYVANSGAPDRLWLGEQN